MSKIPSAASFLEFDRRPLTPEEKNAIQAISYDTTSRSNSAPEIVGYHEYGAKPSDPAIFPDKVLDEDHYLFTDLYGFHKFQAQVYQKKTDQPDNALFEGSALGKELRAFVDSCKTIEDLEERARTVNRWVNKKLNFDVVKYQKKSANIEEMSPDQFADYWNPAPQEILKQERGVCFDFARVNQEILRQVGIDPKQTSIVHCKRVTEKGSKDRIHSVLLARLGNKSFVIDQKYEEEMMEASAYFSKEKEARPLYVSYDGKLIPYVPETPSSAKGAQEPKARGKNFNPPLGMN